MVWPRNPEIYDQPSVQIAGNQVLNVYARVYNAPTHSYENAAYVTTQPSTRDYVRASTGQVVNTVPTAAIEGCIGRGTVYRKDIRTDQPLSGLRTAIARRRAAKRVKSLLR
jgi:hypothetical protein